MNYSNILAIAGCVIVLLSHPNNGIAGEPVKTINERLLVMPAAPLTTATWVDKVASENAYDSIVEFLADRGYRLVDKPTSERCSQELAATSSIDPSLNQAASFGLKFFAEYTISYKISVIAKDRDGEKGALVKVTARIVENTSAQILASKSAEASSAGITLEDALGKAGRSAGKKMAESLAVSLEKNYAELVKAGRAYTVVIDNAAGGQNLLPLLTGLEENRRVFTAREIEGGGGKVSFEITYLGKRDQLDRDILALAGGFGWQLRKVRSEGNRSSWRIE